MSRSAESTLIPLLASAVHSVRTTPPRIIASPPTQPRRAAVALVLRVVPPPNYFIPPVPLNANANSADGKETTTTNPLTMQEFFESDWVNAPGARAEILYLRRAKAPSASPDVHDKLQANGGKENNVNGGRLQENGNAAGARRRKRDTESHVAFPGGRMEEGDEDGLYTAMRQTWEEIGLDLAEKSFLCVGQLDDREITTSLGKRLLMVLSPYVFLQLSPQTQPTDPPPGTTLHWTALSILVGRRLRWESVTVDISSRLAPREGVLRALVKVLVGTMRFDAIVLDGGDNHSASTNNNNGGNSNGNSNGNTGGNYIKDGWTSGGQDGVPKKKKGSKIGPNFVSVEVANEKYDPSNYNPSSPTTRGGGKSGRGGEDGGGGDELRLWGLTLGMTMDLMNHMKIPTSFRSAIGGGKAFGMSSPGGGGGFIANGGEMTSTIAPMATSMTSVFPRFSYPDVNFWIWVFGKRYRQIIHGWEESMSAGGTNDRRINWTGSALQAFYAAVRKALVVVIVLRALGILTVLGISGWWLFYRP